MPGEIRSGVHWLDFDPLIKDAKAMEPAELIYLLRENMGLS